MLRLGLSEFTFEGADESVTAQLAEVFACVAHGRHGRAVLARDEVCAALTRPYHYTSAQLRRGMHVE